MSFNTFDFGDGINLVGTLHKPETETSAGVVISHGFTANRGRQRLIDLANGLSENGIATFRYDSGGTGESEVCDITVRNLVEDCGEAVRFMRDQGYEQIGLMGESLGGLTSLMSYDTGIRTMVLWAPVTTGRMPGIYEQPGIKEALSRKGHYDYEKDGRTFRIPQAYFDQRTEVEQERLLETVRCPVLILHGDEDISVPLQDSLNATTYLHDDSEVRIIDGVGHFLAEGSPEVIPMTVDWFGEKMQ
jgi:alpha-beta hydrolase superfamily lysophospholipase